MADESPIDTLGMWAATADLPEQVAAAALVADRLDGLPEHESIENVVVLGMGGSGIAGDILLAVAGPFMPVPAVVVKDYELPAFVGEGTLAFAISFSGNTEETLEAVTEAAAQGAKVVAVTGGGELAKLAAGWGAPVVSVPSTIPKPRAALGAQAIPPLVVLEDVGLFPGARRWIDLAVGQLQRRRDRLQMDGNLAEDIARRIGRTIPLVHGGGPVGAAAAARWKAQVNENPNSPAFAATVPELCHNEFQGWGQHGDVTRHVVSVVQLRHDAEHPQTVRRFEYLAESLREVVADVIEVRAEGEGDLAQLLDLVLIGDFVSLHLAAQEGIDPGPIDALDQLKAAVSAS